jgi:soluble lytic murein transglycosylase-like protein
MLIAVSRCLVPVAFALTILAQPALARGHVDSHRGSYRHHHAYLASAYDHHRAHHAWRRRFYASAAMESAAAPFGGETPFAYGAPTPSFSAHSFHSRSWRQRDAWGAMQRQDYANPSTFGRYDGRPSRQFANRYAAERSNDASGQRAELDGMAAQQASANGVPVSLVHRVIMRESRYNPRAVSRGNYGLMQIRLGTARAMGYGGSASGLLDAATNMTYAVRYLAGAYRAAGGNESRAVALYARGYNAARVGNARAVDRPLYASFAQPASDSSAANANWDDVETPFAGTQVAYYRVHHHRHRKG